MSMYSLPIVQSTLPKTLNLNVVSNAINVPSYLHTVKIKKLMSKFKEVYVVKIDSL